MSVVRRAVVVTFGERFVLGVLTVAQTAIISRLLGPAEVGLALIGMAAVQIIDTVRDFGTTIYVIQKQDLSQRSIRTVFTVLVLTSVLAAVALLACAGLFATYYAQPGLVSFLQVLSLSFLFLPISNPRTALMRRDFHFGFLACTNVTAALAYAVTVVALAASGTGFMSVAWATLASAVASALVSLCVRPHPWMFRPCLSDWREALRFGGCTSATNLMNRGYELLPLLLLGRLFPIDVVGLYSRAWMVSQLPDRLLLSSIAGIVLPTFSAQTRDKAALKEAYLAGLGFIAVVQWPMLILLALTAEPVIRLLLGPAWLEITPLVQVMAMASMVTFASMLSSPILVASGGLADTLTSSVVSLSLSTVVVVVATAYGPTGLALSLLVTLPLQLAVVLWFIRRRLELGWIETAAALRRSALVTGTSAAIPAAVVAIGGGFNLSLPLAALSAAGAFVGWIVGIVAFAHPIYPHIRSLLMVVAQGASWRVAQVR